MILPFFLTILKSSNKKVRKQVEYTFSKQLNTFLKYIKTLFYIQCFAITFHLKKLLLDEWYFFIK